MAASDNRVTRRALLDEGHGWLFESTFLAHLSPEEQECLLARMRWRSYAAGATIVEQGREAPGMDLIVAGEAAVWASGPGEGPRAVASLFPGHILGERSLFRREPANAKVLAVSPVQSLQLTAADFRAALERSANFQAFVRDLIELRDRSAELLELLLAHRFLRSLGRADLERLIRSGRVERAAAGTFVVAYGEPSGDAYLLVRGKVDVYAPSADGSSRELLTTKGPGWFFGHAAALLDRARSADVVASAPTELLRIPAKALMSIIQRNPTVGRRILQDLAITDLRLASAEKPTERAPVIAVFGSRRGLGATSLGYGFAALLAEEREVVLVDLDGEASAQRLGAPLRREGQDAGAPRSWALRGRRPLEVQCPPSGEVALGPWLEELGHRAGPGGCVVLDTAGNTERDRGAVALADVAVFLRGAGETSYPQAAPRRQQRLSAIRCQPDGLLPLETTGQHVRFVDDAESLRRFWSPGGGDPASLLDPARPFGRALRRLHRIWRGRSVGLALGGGAALGYAHVGLLRALEEQGFAIDCVAGTSFGAIVAGYYAAGGLACCERLVTHRKRIFRDLLLKGLLSSRLIEELGDELIGARIPLSSTEIPFYPVGVDINTGRQVVRAHGTVGQGIRASTCLPPVFSSLRMGTSRVVDGGFLNNVPASVAWAAGAQFILASNVVPEFPFGTTSVFDSPTGRLFASSLGRVEEILRAMFLLISQTGRDRAALADFVFDLNMKGYTPFDFLQGDAIAEAGYEQAMRQMPDILAAYQRRTLGPAGDRDSIPPMAPGDAAR